jgi:imidazolonepropionase-like amidohydrolase
MPASMRFSALCFSLLLAIGTPLGAAAAPTFGPAVTPFVAVGDAVVAITNVRVIDGTGAAPREHQDVVFSNGIITAIGPDGGTTIPASARRVDGAGMSLLPGYVGTHNHLYYVSGVAPDGFFIAREQPTSFPRMYLAAGVTTMRTTGSNEPFTDINLKKQIDAGHAVGPEIDVTAPYLTGPGNVFAQMQVLKDAKDARETVDYWADRGFTSFKAYTDISHDELAAVVDEAHKRGLKVAGHLCSIGFQEAAKLGIDSLEHGLFVDTEFDSEKEPDHCPSTASSRKAMLATSIDSPAMHETIAALVRNHVAVSSTLAIFESFGKRPLSNRSLAMLDVESLADVTASHARAAASPNADDLEVLLKKEMAFERAFVHAGGLLTTGPDPTGFGGVIAGFGDQRGIELLVEAGFTPVEAIRIATRNGAQLLGRLATVGTLEVGKHADAVLVRGNPAEAIGNIENVVYTFKDGVGYDSAKLIESVRGMVGRR